MYAYFDPNNLLHWFSLIIAISGILTLLISLKRIRLQYKKPKIEILEISAKPTIDDKWGGRESDCFIRFRVINPSSFGNHISGKLHRFYFPPCIVEKIYQFGNQVQTGSHIELPPFKGIVISMYPRYEKVERYKNKHLLLTICDIRGKKTRKWFIFKDYKK